MGAYLSSPICDKETIEGSNDRLAFAASSMQGWRMSQEDAHNAILNYDQQTSFFAVYDGHGGAEIALYCSRHLPDFLKQLNAYREGRLQEALTEGFLKFDALLLEPNVKEILRTLAEEKEKNDDEDEEENEEEDEDEDETSKEQSQATATAESSTGENNPEELNAEEAQLLKKEAEVPIEELLKSYSGKVNEQGKDFHSPNISKRAAQNPLNDEEKKQEVPNVENNNEAEPKSEVVTHTNEENILMDDVLDHKIAETTENGEVTESTEPKPSSSEAKTTSRRARKAAAVSTDAISSSLKGAVKAKSLTHHLLGGDLDELEEDEDDDEDDFELNESDEETTDDNAESDEENAEGENEDEEEEETEEENDDENEEKPLSASKKAQMKKLMRKSIMAILNQRLKKKKKRGDDSEDEAKENQMDEEDNDDEEQDDDDDDEEDDDDEDGDTDLGKMLDMGNDPGSSSGCTAVVALLRDKQLFVANAGDSRCVVCRAGRAVEMSIDHKPEDSLERTRIEKAGYKVTLDGRVSGGLNLSRAIGDHAYKKTPNLPAEEQAITALPDIRTLTLEDQDEFMIIACDGIWNFMSSQDVVDYVRQRLDKKSLRQITEELFMHCLAPNTSGDGTGCDNMTAIIVKFNLNQSTKSSTDEKTPSFKSTEHSPWATMFTSASNKRALSPDHQSTTEALDENNSKKAKMAAENGTNEVTSPSRTAETFSFVATAAAASTANDNNNNSNDDQQH